MQNKNDRKDMSQPNSFQEQGQNNSTSVPTNDKNDTKQPNSFQEQPPHEEKEEAISGQDKVNK